MRKAIIAVLFGAAFGGFTTTPIDAGDIYKIEPKGSKISFGVHHFIGMTAGSFSRFGGTIEIDREHPDRSAVQAQISVKSIDTGIRKRDDHLASAEFFDADKFPLITFKSRSVKQTGPDSADVVGDLTMHGVARALTLHVRLVSPVGASHEVPVRTHWAVTTESLKRRDFGLLFSRSAEAISGIGQEVTVTIAIEAVRAR